jgi:nucleotide-binding universal stress UspA family protein
MFNCLLVGLDRTEVDISLIKYTSFICELYEPKEVYFIHIEKELEDSIALLQKEGKKEVRAIDELIKKELNEKVENYFEPNNKVKVHIEIHEGSLLTGFLHWSRINKVDLIVMGSKHTQTGSGILAKQVARKADCSLLIVPEDACPEISKIVIPIDFSAHSAMGCNRGVELAGLAGDTSLVLLHAFWVPGWYQKVGYNYAEYKIIEANNAKEKNEAFLEKIDLKRIELTSQFLLVPNSSSSAKKMVREAKRNGANLLVIGSRGKSGVATFFLGSTTERLIDYNRKIPLLVEKEPGGNITLLDVLLGRKE